MPMKVPAPRFAMRLDETDRQMVAEIASYHGVSFRDGIRQALRRELKVILPHALTKLVERSREIEDV
jgi:hypothetical protein